MRENAKDLVRTPVVVPDRLRSLFLTIFLVLGASEQASAQLPSCGLPLQPLCPQCRDGVDNDRDAVTDLADLGCSSPQDSNEGDDPAPDVGGTATVDIDPRSTGKLFGFNTGLSSWSSGISIEQEAALIRNVGGNAQRMNIQWKRVEPARDQLNESALAWVDAMETELRANGMRAILTVWEAPRWATDLCPVNDLVCIGDTEPRFSPPKEMDIDEYASFLAWVARRYPEAAIETWNEPNIKGFWNANPWPDAARMARMQCAAYDAIKDANPSTTVLAPGLAFVSPPPTLGKTSYPYLEFLRSLYQQMGRVCWDALSIHIYAGTSIDGPDSVAAKAFRVYRNLRSQYGDTTPIWITETGATTSGNGEGGRARFKPEEQRDINRAAVNEFLSTPDVGAVIIHTLRDRPLEEYDDPNDPKNGDQYGLGLLDDGVGPTPSPKPAYCHFIWVVGGIYPGC
jgi:hypothetical protein